MEFLHNLWGTTWYGNCEKPQAAAINNMGANNLLISYELSETNRAYNSFKNVDKFLERYPNDPDKPDQHYYEIIQQNNSLYFDIDFKISDYNLIDTITNFITLLKKSFIIEFGRKLLDKHIFILSASNELKGSLHFIIKNGFIFRTPEEMKLFIMKVHNARDISKLGSVIDLGVYHTRRAFRLIHSTKFGGDRPLYPISAKGNRLKKFDPANYFISNMPDINKFYYDEPQQIIPQPINIDDLNEQIIVDAIKLYKNTSGSISHNTENNTIKYLSDKIISITFKRINSSFCTMCKRSHDRANTANIKIFLDSNKIFECCHKSEKTIFIGNITPELAKEIEPEISGPDFISAAISSATKFKPKFIEKIIHNEITEQVKIANIIKYSEKFCGNNSDIINSNAVIIAQRASMGTGKTNAAASRVIARYNNSADCVVIISFRVSLAEQLTSDKFADIKDLKCYNKIKGNIYDNKIVIQPESLHRYSRVIGSRDYLNNEIIIDEVSQVRKQFTSSTFLKNPESYRSWQKFKMIVRGSKHVHIMDANLTATDIKWIQDIRKNNDEIVEVYWNTYKNLDDRQISLTNCENDIIHSAVTDLNAGKKIYIASNSSTEKILAISEMLKQTTNKKILCICSETLSDDAVKKSIDNPNIEWGKYDAVICSPSVQSGISYDKPEIFENIYGIFSNFSSGSADCAQMLNRIRQPINKNTLVSISMGNNNIGPTNRADIIHSIEHNRDHINAAISDRIKNIERVCDYEISEYGHNEYIKNDLFNLIVDNEAARNKDLNYFIWNFIRDHHAAGYKITEFNAVEGFGVDDIEAVKNIQQTYKKLIKTIRDNIKTTNAHEISEAVNKSITDIERITKKLNENREISKDDKMSLLKFNITKTYATDINKSPEWFKFYGDIKTRNIFNNQNRLLKHKHFSDALDDIQHKEKLKFDNKTLNMFANPESDYTYGDAVLSGVIDYINVKPIYKKYKIMTETLEIMGFNSIDTAIEIPAETMQQNIKTIHNNIRDDTENYIKTMGKRSRKIEAITRWKYDDPKFYKNMLQFINGSLTAEFGITIGKVSNNSTQYKLKNSFLDNSATYYFNNINRPIEQQKPGHDIPDIG